MKVVNRQNYDFPKQGGGSVKVTGVLTEDDAGLFAVYVGHGDDNWIAAAGAKLPLRMAVFFFPNLEEKEYRK